MLTWHGMRGDEGHVLRRMLAAPAPEKRRRGRQKTRWKDSCKSDMESVGLKEENTLNRATLNNDIQYNSGDPRLRKSSMRRRTFTIKGYILLKLFRCLVRPVLSGRDNITAGVKRSS